MTARVVARLIAYSVVARRRALRFPQHGERAIADARDSRPRVCERVVQPSELRAPAGWLVQVGLDQRHASVPGSTQLRVDRYLSEQRVTA